MKSTIVYIHGYGSGPTGSTAQDIKKSFPSEKFLSPKIDHSQDPDLIKAQMDKLAKTLTNHNDVIIVGSSAGGFWADYLGAVYGFKTVLVNPSLRPATNYKKYNLPAEYYEKYIKLQDWLKHHTRHHMVAYAGDKDEVVPLEHVKTHYKNPIMLKGEGHRLKNMTPVVKMIQSMIGNFPEHN
jgi:predicted esterase YcpF (UPF0227 family)